MGMGMTRINLGLAQPMLKDLDKLAAKYGFDRTNAIRYCIRFTCDAEAERLRKALHEALRSRVIRGDAGIWIDNIS